MKNRFRLKVSNGGLVELAIKPQFDEYGFSKSFWSPDSDGHEFKEFLKSLKDGDEVIIEFKKNTKDILEERLRKLIDEHIEELLAGLD
jgi:hypothetical protein